jgi:hypothetical protein
MTMTGVASFAIVGLRRTEQNSNAIFLDWFGKRFKLSNCLVSLSSAPIALQEPDRINVPIPNVHRTGRQVSLFHGWFEHVLDERRDPGTISMSSSGMTLIQTAATGIAPGC